MALFPKRGPSLFVGKSLQLCLRVFVLDTLVSVHILVHACCDALKGFSSVQSLFGPTGLPNSESFRKFDNSRLETISFSNFADWAISKMRHKTQTVFKMCPNLAAKNSNNPAVLSRGILELLADKFWISFG